MGWLRVTFVVVCEIQMLSALQLTVYPKVNPIWVLEGTPINLTCQVKSDKEVSIEWFKDFTPLTDFGFKSSKSVKTDPATGTVEMNVTATKMDAQIEAYGVYLCQAGVREKMKNVHIFSVYLKDSNITVGENVTIRCDPHLSLEQLHVEWWKGGVPLHSIPELKERLILSNNNYTLTLTHAKANDSGVYECNIIFLAGTPSEQRFSQTVKMFGKPHLRANTTKSEISVERNAVVDLYCPVQGYPFPDVTWLKGDDILEPSDKHLINLMSNKTMLVSHLQIRGAKEDDIGDYMCNVENSLGRTYKQFQIKIDGVVNHASPIGAVLSHVVLFVVSLLLCFL